ncbi:uncharacterized protein LOC120366098 [Saimiri boliviensis]|uniref:uncharacterized protein LOC120366098 n=1 Tax=Saimiri boliviensis TaxID=27679 RepID=UPI00193D7613|nr:CASP-like protein 4U1 [Saimiri boliviensis boliviensis]
MVSARGIPLLLLESRSSHTLSSSPQHSWRSPSPRPAFLPSSLCPRPPSPPCDRRRGRRGSRARTRLLRSPLQAPPPPSGPPAPASSPSPPPNGCCFGLRGSKTTAEAPPAPRSATAQAGGRPSDPPPSVLRGAAEADTPSAGAQRGGGGPNTGRPWRIVPARALLPLHPRRAPPRPQEAKRSGPENPRDPGVLAEAPRMRRGAGSALPQRKSPAEPGLAAAGSGGVRRAFCLGSSAVGTACLLGFEPRCGSQGSRVPSPTASSPPPEPLPEEALPSRRCGCFWQKVSVLQRRAVSNGTALVPAILPRVYGPPHTLTIFRQGLDHRTAVFSARPSSGGLALPLRLGHH